MLPGKGGFFYDGPLNVADSFGIDVFHHDDCVAAVGQGVAGIDPVGGLAEFKAQGIARGSGKGVFGIDGNAVHGCSVKCRGRPAGRHRTAEHAVKRLSQGNGFFRQAVRVGVKP